MNMTSTHLIVERPASGDKSEATEDDIGGVVIDPDDRAEQTRHWAADHGQPHFRHCLDLALPASDNPKAEHSPRKWAAAGALSSFSKPANTSIGAWLGTWA